MGNRAVIAFEGQSVGIYLHWNGGPESVYAFLDYADQTVGRARGWDDNYCIARLCQIIGNFMGGVHSVGLATDIDPVNLKTIDDNYGLDNGVYVVGAATDKTRRYRMIARYDGDKLLTEAEIKKEETLARKHDYWKAENGIVQQIREKNDQFFAAKELA